MLLARERERTAIEGTLEAARAGRGGGLVFSGEPGAGKSALLADAAERAGGMTVLAAAGAEAEATLAYATLHQLLRPLLGGLDQLPEPRRAPSGSPWASARGPRRIASWSRWRPSPCSRRPLASGRCSACWTTRSGPTPPPWRWCGSWPGASSPTPSR